MADLPSALVIMGAPSDASALGQAVHSPVVRSGTMSPSAKDARGIASAIQRHLWVVPGGLPSWLLPPDHGWGREEPRGWDPS